MTNILITGIKGFIGSHLSQHLAKDKSNIIYGLYRSTKYESVFNTLNLNNIENINLIQGNVNNLNDVYETIVQYDIDNIYHLAAKVIVQDAAKFPVVTFNTNVFGTLNILESIRLMKLNRLKSKEIPTFIMSSDKAYGISDKLPYTEDLPLNGMDIYSASKACEDIISRSYAYTYDLSIVVGRPGNTYGLDFNWSRLIPSLAKSCLSSSERYAKPLILNEGSFKYIREYNYILDTVSAIELLIKDIDVTKGQAYNISSGFKYTTEEVVNEFFKHLQFGKRIEFKKKDAIFKEIPEQYLDSSKLMTDVGWKPKYNLEDGLSETIRLYKSWFNTNINCSCCSCHPGDIEICKQKH